MALPAHAASFDCAKASSKVEKLICGDAELSKLDDDLNAGYKAALRDEKRADSIKLAQKQWIKERNGCEDETCVRRAYESRIASLNATQTPSDSEESDVYTSASIDMDESGRPFNLVKGKGVKVCEIYQKNLEALGNPNLACQRKVSPEYVGIIKLPSWRKLDLWENRNLWAQVEKIIHGGLYTPGAMESKGAAMDDQYQIDQLVRQYQEHSEKYREEVYKLNVAEMNLDNDERNESVLRYGSGLCGEPVHFKSIALFVLDEKGDTVDLQKSRPLFQDVQYNPSTKELEQNGVLSNGSMYDVFFYIDKTYFDRWTSSGIWIYKISNGKTEAICHLN